MAFRYFYLNRPPCIGCQPDGFTATEGGLPKRYWETSAGKIDSFGWVEYPQKLDFDTIYRFDLLPDDPVERGRFMIWYQCDRNMPLAESMIEEYSKQPVDWLEFQARRDIYAHFTLMILEAQGRAN